MKHLLLVSLILTAFCNSFGQDNDLKFDFVPLKSQGEVPDEINLKSSKKYNKRKEKLKAKKRSELKDKEKFILESTFAVDYMISSGAVLFNDELTSYVNAVADELLKDDPTLRKELRFYTLKSPFVNAYTTDQGIIFVTVGLLSRLENEAQLAFVLAHEISHYTKKHTMNVYLESKKIEEGKGEYDKIDWEDKLLAKSNYSQDKESEADSVGIQLMEKSKYDLSEVDGAFSILENAELGIQEIPFDLSYFESEYYRFPSDYQKQEIAEIEKEEEENSTHPSVDKRKKITKGQIERLNHAGTAKQIVLPEGVERIRDLAAFELSYLYLKKKYYAIGLYNSLILQKKYPFNEFLKINIAYCLYGLTKYKNASREEEVLVKSEQVPGERQRLNYFFEKITDKELNILAVKHLWELKSKLNSEYIDFLAEDALKDLIYEHKLNKNEFKKNYPAIDSVQVDTTQAKKDTVPALPKYNAVTYAFVNLFNQDDFAKQFKTHTREKKKSGNNSVSEIDQEKFDLKDQAFKVRRGRALGLDKIGLVSPSVRSFDTRKGGYEKYFHGEDRRDVFIDLNEYCAQKSKLDLEMLSTSNFENSEKYSNVSLLNDWVEERFSHGGMAIYPYLSSFSPTLEARYGTKYYMWSGIYTLRTKKHAGNYFLFLLGSAYVFVPASIYYALSDSQHTFYYSFLFDVSNGDAHMIKNEYFKSKDRQDYMKSYIYDTYHQIKQKKK
ncbi:MAG: M48 family metallopeptidase [Flavobacteriales bacterium]|nr:M48 family metallopeptidase [Flavobacteriales bacterium]